MYKATYYCHQSRAVAGNGNAFQQNCISKEQKLTEALKKAIPGITYVSVEDISGGCGAMYEVSIDAISVLTSLISSSIIFQYFNNIIHS